MLKTDSRFSPNFNGIWLKGNFGEKQIDVILDSGCSAVNVMPKTIANDLGIQTQFNGRSVTTIGNEKVEISDPIDIEFDINGYHQTEKFVIIDTDLQITILGMPFIQKISSINFNSKIIYARESKSIAHGLHQRMPDK